MSDKPTDDPVLVKLRERESELCREIGSHEERIRELGVWCNSSRAVLAEVRNIIELVERGGKRKPGPKARVEQVEQREPPELAV